MGRRKIEIQPITHERNRSVTFLKRKNGLFKKAYELGVLCSVDVAVIIFEERPGHHVKLYQYGSTDIHDIVQRHLRHDGEKDTRGPPDFSGNANTKLDDIGDGDEDDQDEDDDLPSRSVRKRGPDGKLKSTQDLVNNMDYGSSHRLTIPQPLSMHGLGPPSGGGGSTLPISSMRDPNVNNKRSRIGIPSSHSRSPSDDLPPPGSGPGPYSYHPGQNSAPFNRPSNSPYQQHHPPQHHASQHHASQQHHQHHHQGQQQQQQHHSNQQYQPFFSQAVSSHTSPPPSFIPLQSDFSRSSGPSSRSGGAGSGGGPGFGLPTRTNSSSSSYETGLYSGMIRGPSGSSNQSSGPAGGGGSSATGGGGGDLFAAFLDADEQTRHQSQPSQGSGFALDWPVHSTSGSGGGGNTGGGGSSAPSVPSTSSSSGAPGSGLDVNANINNISS